MDPARKRKIRLFVALGVAVLLAVALVAVSFLGATEARTPSDLLSSTTEEGRSYELTGRVADGTVERDGDVLRFDVRDREGTASVPVEYQGVVPDPFREGREVIVSGSLTGGTFMAARDSLITKCPSKFTNAEEPA